MIEQHSVNNKSLVQGSVWVDGADILCELYMGIGSDVKISVVSKTFAPSKPPNGPEEPPLCSLKKPPSTLKTPHPKKGPKTSQNPPPGVGRRASGPVFAHALRALRT